MVSHARAAGVRVGAGPFPLWERSRRYKLSAEMPHSSGDARRVPKTGPGDPGPVDAHELASHVARAVLASLGAGESDESPSRDRASHDRAGRAGRGAEDDPASGLHVLGVAAAGDATRTLVVALVVAPEPSHAELLGILESRFGLTRREASVAALLVTRRSSLEIACALGISPHTARHHVERVLGKLGIRSRGDVAATVASATASRLMIAPAVGDVSALPHAVAPAPARRPTSRRRR